VAIVKQIILLALVSGLVTLSASAGQFPPVSAPGNYAHNQSPVYLEKSTRAQSSLPAKFFENDALVTDSASYSDTTAPTATAFFQLQLNGPLVPINTDPNPINPSSGTPLIITPEPDAFWSAGLCLLILVALKACSAWKKPRGKQLLSQQI